MFCDLSHSGNTCNKTVYLQAKQAWLPCLGRLQQLQLQLQGCVGWCDDRRWSKESACWQRLGAFGRPSCSRSEKASGETTCQKSFTGLRLHASSTCDAHCDDDRHALKARTKNLNAVAVCITRCTSTITRHMFAEQCCFQFFVLIFSTEVNVCWCKLSLSCGTCACTITPN